MYFFLSQRKFFLNSVYYFFNFLFDILEWYKFGLCITAWRRGFCVWLYCYLSKRVSLCSRCGLFAIPSIILSHLELLRVDYQINFKYFNENCDYFSCPGWWILLLYASLHKDLDFWKNYLSASLSLHFHIVLISLASY